jgi:hypothetical protein
MISTARPILRVRLRAIYNRMLSVGIQLRIILIPAEYRLSENFSLLSNSAFIRTWTGK